MKTIIISIIILITFSGCAALEVVGKNLVSLNDLYCKEEAADARQFLIERIRKIYPDYPEGGLCGTEKYIINLFKK